MTDNGFLSNSPLLSSID